LKWSTKISIHSKPLYFRTTSILKSISYSEINEENEIVTVLDLRNWRKTLVNLQ